MKRKSIVVEACRYSCEPELRRSICETVDRLKDDVPELSLEWTDPPCSAGVSRRAKADGGNRNGRLLIGCPLFCEARRSNNGRPAITGPFEVFDIHSHLIRRYGRDSVDTLLYDHLLSSTARLQGRQPYSDKPVVSPKRVLLIGDGPSALSLADAGMQVDVIGLGDEHDLPPGMLRTRLTEPEWMQALRDNATQRSGIELLEKIDPATLRRAVRFSEKEIRVSSIGNTYGAIVCAPDTVEGAAPERGAVGLTGLYDRLTHDQRIRGTVALLLDYPERSTSPVFGDALVAALELRLRHGAEVYLFGEDALVDRDFQEDLYTRCREAGVVFVRHAGKIAAENDYGDFTLTGVDEAAGSEITLDHPDLVVIPGRPELSQLMKELAASFGVRLTAGRFLQPESLWRLPNMTNRAGIFVCGTAGRDLDRTELRRDVEALTESVAGRLSEAGKTPIEHIPVVDEELCAFCLTCVRVCPFGAMTQNREKRVAESLPALCEGCGICAAECPAGAIEIRNFSDDTLRTAARAHLGGIHLGAGV